MVEPEIALDLMTDVALAELLEVCFWGGPGRTTGRSRSFKSLSPRTVSRDWSLVSSSFTTMTYTDAVAALEKAARTGVHSVPGKVGDGPPV